jgi:outer membrane protein assembly factor BamA
MPRTTVLLAAMVLGLAAQPSIGQNFLAKTIHFKGDPEYSDQELMAAAGLKSGIVMDSAGMNGYAKRLLDSGVFDNVAYRFDGEDLTFILTPDPTLYPVRLENLPFTPGPELDAELHARCPLYHGRVPSEGGLLNDVRQAFEAMLAAEGVHAGVAAAPYNSPKDRTKITAISFTITAPFVRLGPVRIEGASMALLPRLHAMTSVAAPPAFDSQKTAAGLERSFVTFYLDQGFAAVKVHAARSGALVTTADAILVPYSVTIQEGRLYKIASIHVPSGALVTQQEADTIVASPGKRTMGEALQTVLSLIDERYKSKGYLDLSVNYHPSLNDLAGTVVYTVDIAPGPVYRVPSVTN